MQKLANAAFFSTSSEDNGRDFCSILGSPGLCSQSHAQCCTCCFLDINLSHWTRVHCSPWNCMTHLPGGDAERGWKVRRSSKGQWEGRWRPIFQTYSKANGRPGSRCRCLRNGLLATRCQPTRYVARRTEPQLPNFPLSYVKVVSATKYDLVIPTRGIYKHCIESLLTEEDLLKLIQELKGEEELSPKGVLKATYRTWRR